MIDDWKGNNNSNYSYISNYLYKLLIIVGSVPGKTNYVTEIDKA